MRILQLIDSLQTGGAERVAVNIANALPTNNDESHLCTTRAEGLLKDNLSESVQYLFLNKTRTLDLKAIKRLYSYVKQHNIEVIHAHSTSFFLATVVKLLHRNVKLVWHDHYGESEFLDNRNYKVLRFCSRYFSHIFSVNVNLELWAKKHLKCHQISYLPNFAVPDNKERVTVLKGEIGKRIVCLANLRPQKDHLTLINAFNTVVRMHHDWTLHCVGKDFHDDYSKSVKYKIDELGLNKSVFLYGSKPDISAILDQCDIGVLSSKSEGLPIALLEYGLAGLAVLVTDVGDCAKVVLHDKCGIVVPKEHIDQFANSLMDILENEKKLIRFGNQLKLRVMENYSEQKCVKTLTEIYHSIA